MLGQVLNDRYQIDESIGSGGMALVFRGQDLLLGRKVAIKVLRPQFVSDADFIRRFQREARSAASLNHPNIVNVYDIGQDGDVYYLVMENIEGINLKEKIIKDGPLPLEQALTIMEQICQALAAAHRNDIIHCDIKPHNILLNEEGIIKVTDFGIARAMSSGTMTYSDTVVGSAPYISPEQAKGENITPSSDIYSLGVVAYEIFAGCPPFKGESPITIALKHIRETPEPVSRFNPSLPSFIEQIVMQALEKTPEERYENAEEILKDIREALDLITSGALQENNHYVDAPTQEIPRLKGNEEIEEISKEFDEDKADYQEEQEEKVEKAVLPVYKKKINHALSPFLLFFQNYKFYFLVPLIILVLVLGAWASYKWYMSVPLVEVPELKGFDVDNAEEQLRNMGLAITVEGEQHHREIPEGKIVSQFPASGQMIRATRDVNVVLSKGPLWSKVPELTGLSLRDAEVILGAAGLQIGEIEYEFDEDIETNIIISQKPEGGEEIKAEEPVNIIVSRGGVTTSVNVPHLLGLAEEEAKEKISALGLNLGETKEEESLRFLEGQVSQQEPPPGTPVGEGTRVHLTFSSGILNPDNAPVYTPGIRIPVPPGKPEQEIRIVIEDLNGRHVVYDKIHEPGDRVFYRANTVGPTVIKIYIDGNLVKEEKIG